MTKSKCKSNKIYIIYFIKQNVGFVQMEAKTRKCLNFQRLNRNGRDSNPRYSYLYTRLAIELFRPLRHHSFYYLFYTITRGLHKIFQLCTFYSWRICFAIIRRMHRSEATIDLRYMLTFSQNLSFLPNQKPGCFAKKCTNPFLQIKHYPP